MEKDKEVAVTLASLADTPVSNNAEAGESSAAEKCHEGRLSDDGVWLSDCDEEVDETFYLDREGKRRREEFYNAGYRDGLTAGKNVAVQEGFNQGFRDSVMIGNKWGIVRGVTSALAHIPNELKLKLLVTEEKGKEFQSLFVAVDSIGTQDALKLFHDHIQRGKSAEGRNTIESESSITQLTDSQRSDLESYFAKLDLLLRESPIGDLQLELNKIRLS